MAYKSRYNAKSSAVPQNPRQRFIITVIVVLVLLYFFFFWAFPALVNGIGFIASIFKTPSKPQTSIAQNLTLAPPVFNIPYEATNSATIDISGYATPGSRIELFMDDNLKDTIKANSDGNFTFKDIDLVIGTNNIYGKVLDDRNKESLPSETIQLVYDNQNPTLNVTEPQDGQQIQGVRQLNVSGSTDPDDKLYVSDGQVVVKSDGSFSTQISLNDGDNTIVIKSVSKAGNSTQVTKKVHFQQ